MKRNVLVIGHCGELGLKIRKEFLVNNYEVYSICNYKELLLGYGFQSNSTVELPLSDADFVEYQQQMSRRGTYYNNIPELKNEFALSQYMCLDYLRSNNIDLVYFANIPHEGFDYVVERIARYLNLQVVITYQSIFKNRFFIFSDIEDLGEVSGSNNYPRLTVESFNKQGLSYMKSVKGFAPPSEVVSKKVSDFSTRVNKFLRNLVHLGSFRHRFLKLLELNDDFIYRRKIKELFTFKLHELSTDYDYIYFPLHLQPELTTSALGREYDDQALAIERLSRILPKNYFILVKENPKQSSRYRGKNWFVRIKKIPNVLFVDGSIKSSSLIKLSKATATINGTVGWESVILNKPVIYFGTAWFKSFSNVYKFSKNLCIDNIVQNYTSNDIDTELSRLSETMPVGIVDQYYADSSSGTCYLENAKLVVSAITKYINED